MIELAYTSTASWNYSPQDLRDILETSRSRNSRDGITGILLYRGQSVLQLLEGEEAPVRELYARLLRDRRHHSLHRLFERPLAARAFADWSMAFEQLPGHAPFGPDVFPLTRKALVPRVAGGSRGASLIETFLQHVR